MPASPVFKRLRQENQEFRFTVWTAEFQKVYIKRPSLSRSYTRTHIYIQSWHHPPKFWFNDTRVWQRNLHFYETLIHSHISGSGTESLCITSHSPQSKLCPTARAACPGAGLSAWLRPSLPSQKLTYLVIHANSNQTKTQHRIGEMGGDPQH